MSEQAQAAGSPGQLVADNRILVISRVGGPPPHRGNRTRMAALLTEMRRLGYAVHFAGVSMAAEEKAATRPLVDEWVWDFESPRPRLSVARLWASLRYRVHWLLRYFRLVDERLDDLFREQWFGEARDLQQQRQYSRVLVPYIYNSKFLLAFPDPCLRILDTIDAFSNRVQQLRTGNVHWSWFTYSAKDEKRGLLRARRCIAIQEHEAAYFRQLIGAQAEVYVVGHLADALSRPAPTVPFPRFGYIGSRKNNFVNQQGIQWFMRQIWPRIRGHLPEAEFWLGGEADTAGESGPGLRILGKIPHLSDFYRDCPVLINPIQTGTGLKIKTIEALMHGRPVVTTRIGAEGLESFVGHGLLVCDSPDEFANAVVGLLSNLSQARQLGEDSLRAMQQYLAANRQSLAAVLSK